MSLGRQPNADGCKFYVVLIKCPLFDLELFDYEQQIKMGIRKYKLFFKKKGFRGKMGERYSNNEDAAEVDSNQRAAQVPGRRNKLCLLI